MEQNRHFTVLVIGENPDELIAKYDHAKTVEPYKVFEFAKVGEYRAEYEKLLESDEEIAFLKRMSDAEFYKFYTGEETTEDVLSTVNPNGKYEWCKIGGTFSVPMPTLDGKEVYKARKKDVFWRRIHMNGKAVYETVWEVVMEGRKPENKEERELYENMKNRTAYFDRYKTKENFVVASTYFWHYAVVDENGWTECEDGMSEILWARNFFNRFVLPLSPDTQITIYECFRR